MDNFTKRIGMLNRHTIPSNLFCFAAARWTEASNRRTQDLVTTLSGHCHIFFVEEAHYDAVDAAHLTVSNTSSHITILTPHLCTRNAASSNEDIERLIASYIHTNTITDFTFWYASPLALQYTRHFKPVLTVYDCFDNVSTLRHPELENELLERADIVFAATHTLYQAKKDNHHNIYTLHASADKAHFNTARGEAEERADQRHLPFPRLGYMGAIDEHFDMELVATIATQKPDWHIVLVGPVVKTDITKLMQYANVHYMGNKPYATLPSYLSGWNAAILPVKDNTTQSGELVTKANEYLAAGIPVIATPVSELTSAFKTNDLIKIAETPEEFETEAEHVLLHGAANQEWLEHVDSYLNQSSWNAMATEILAKMQETIQHHSYINQVA